MTEEPMNMFYLYRNESIPAPRALAVTGLVMDAAGSAAFAAPLAHMAPKDPNAATRFPLVRGRWYGTR
jgi:hypothetical protein